MKKSCIAIVLMVSFSMIILLGCSPKTATFNTSNTNNKSTSTNSSKAKSVLYNLAIPENIVYYRDGNKVIISKEDTRFEPVFKEVKEGIKSINGLYKSRFVIDDLKKKGMLLEFDYSKNETLRYTHLNEEGKIESIHFTKLYFNLDQKDSGSNTMGIEGDEKGPIGLLKLNYDKLISLLNN